MHDAIEIWNRRIFGLTDVVGLSFDWRPDVANYCVTLKLRGPENSIKSWDFVLEGVRGMQIPEFDGYLLQAMQLRFSKGGLDNYCLLDEALVNDMPSGKIKVEFNYLIDLD